MGIKATVLGASGFAGGELLRLLATHPAIDLATLGAHSRAAAELSEVLPHLRAAGPLLPLEEAAAIHADVVFSCLPSGRLPDLLSRLDADLIIDLADDFRADDGWVYGLTEFARDRIAGARRITNPGCYPTAALLCLAPFARRGLLGSPIVIDALSGASGAGRKAEDRLLLATLESNVMAYGTGTHRHVPEIENGLARFGSLDATVSFTPHLVPMARGLLVTAHTPLVAPLSDDDALAILEDAYAEEPFVHAIGNWPATKPLSGSNHAHVSARVDRRSGFLICSAAIDNLGKGAAGQALQNANVALGLGETTGLGGLGVWP